MVVLHHGWIGCGYVREMGKAERNVDQEGQECSYNNISQVPPTEENNNNNIIKKN